MRFLTIIVLFLLFSTLEASYMRSIRVGSFLHQDAAEQSLMELDRYISSNYRLSDLRNEFNFQIKNIRSGKYYVTVIEPVTDKAAVQEILDIVRDIYPNAYPKKIKKPSKSYNTSKHSTTRTTRYEEPKKVRYEEPKRTRRFVNEAEDKDDSGVDYLQQIENIDDFLEEEIVENPVVETPKSLPTRVPQHIAQPTNTTVAVENKVEHKKEETQQYKRFELKRTASLEPEPKKHEDNVFSIFGYEISMLNLSDLGLPSIDFDFSSISNSISSIFGDDEKKQPHNTIHTKHSNNKDSSILETYKLEILVVITFFFLLVLLKIIAIYRQNKENQISIQDIYN